MGFLQSHVGYGGRHGETRLTKQAPARKAIEVESPEQAAAAVKAAAALDRPVLLISAEHASASAGPAWFAQLVDTAKAPFPDCDVIAMLDCGDSPGHALAALREGLRAIRFNGPTFDKIADIAGQPIDGALIEETARRIAEIRRGAEGREGVGAFLEKRQPNWRGD